MSADLHVVVPGPIDQRTGGYIYDERVVQGLRKLGWRVVVHSLEGTLRAVERADLVTASALLDLVSATWLDRLVAVCVEAGCAALFALNYNGEVTWSADNGPGAEVEDPDDRMVWNALSIHQVGDKGLGPSLGPDAAAAALRAFERVGYQCYLSQSSWRLGVDDAALVHRLVKGWAEAAKEILPQESDRISAWADRRSEVVSERRFMLTVGHDDLLALPRDSA